MATTDARCQRVLANLPGAPSIRIMKKVPEFLSVEPTTPS